jgi:hypothetical protein
MPSETSEPEPTEEQKKRVEVHDLTPKSDVKGGATKVKKDEKQATRRTGEIDFMKGVNQREDIARRNPPRP